MGSYSLRPVFDSGLAATSALWQFPFFLILSVLGLRCFTGFSLSAVRGLLTAVTSLIATPRLESTRSVVVAHGLSCSVASGILLRQGWKPCLLHWQADSLSLSHQGSPWPGPSNGTVRGSTLTDTAHPGQAL